uniref:Translocator protein n=1 Tax=Chrysemys picta bellii TaxID=8478 RepID=A0A8C3IT30_CHRPI
SLSCISVFLGKTMVLFLGWWLSSSSLNGLCCLWKELGGFNEESMVPLGLYAGQLALNWAWTPILFGAHKIGWGLVDLLLTSDAATATTVTWYHVNKKAAYLMFSYLDNKNKKQS